MTTRVIMMKAMLHAHCPGVFGTRLKASSVGKMGFQFLSCHTRCQRWFRKVLMKNTGVRFQEVERRERDMWSSPLLCEPWEHQRVQVPCWDLNFLDHFGANLFGTFCGIKPWHDKNLSPLPWDGERKFLRFPEDRFPWKKFRTVWGKKLPFSQSANLAPSVLGPPNLCLIWDEIKI